MSTLCVDRLSLGSRMYHAQEIVWGLKYAALKENEMCLFITYYNYIHRNARALDFEITDVHVQVSFNNKK